MKRNKLKLVIQGIACGTIALNLVPQHLHGQQFDNQFNGTFQEMSVPMLDPYAPAPTAGVAEIEIPGSAYFIGPDGQRLTSPGVYQANSVFGVPQDTGNGGGETIISQEPIYDGQSVYPLGTFPAHEFGERIISQTVAGENGKTLDIPGTLEGGSSYAQGGPENGIPADQVVRPDLDDITDQGQPPEPSGVAGELLPPSNASAESVVVPDKLPQKMGDSSKGVVEKAQLSDLKLQLEKLGKRHDRLKDRLSEANRRIEKLTKEKKKDQKTAQQSATAAEELSAGLETKAEANRLIKELAEAKKMLATANEKLSQTTADSKAMSDKLAALLTAKETTEASLAKLKEDAGADTARLKKQVRGLKSQLKRAESKVAGVNEKSARVVEGLEKDLKAAKADTAELTKALVEAKKKVRETEKERASKEREMDSQFDEIESVMMEKLGAYKKTIALKEKSLEEKVKQLDQKQEMITTLNKKLEATEKKFKAAEKKMAKAGRLVQKSTQELTAELKSSENRLKILEKEMKQKVASAEEMAANLKTDLEKATKEATAANRAADDAKAQLNKMRAESKDLAAKLSEQTTALEMMKSQMLPKQDTNMKPQDSSGVTGIAAAPATNPEPADGEVPKIEITSSDDKAESERDKRDAAMAEVERKLALREAEAKRVQAENEAKMKAQAERDAKEAAMKAEAERAAAKKMAVEEAKAAEIASPLSDLSLEEQIRILKSRRDSLILLAEKKIRKKRESEIDQMISEGKAADSPEVTTALEQLNSAVHNSSEKLTARYRRKIEKLKQIFREKKEMATQK